MSNVEQTKNAVAKKKTDEMVKNGGPVAHVETSVDDGFGDMKEYQALGMVSADGFWNIPKEDKDAKAYIGEKLRGILLANVRENGKGLPIEHSFYVLELTAPHSRVNVKDEKGTESFVTLPKGAKVGVSSKWKALQGLEKYLGYGFEFTFTGIKKLPAGKTMKEFKVLKTASSLRDIERTPVRDEAQGDGDGEKIPFDV